jgi:hypothetical protein
MAQFKKMPVQAVFRIDSLGKAIRNYSYSTFKIRGNHGKYFFAEKQDKIAAMLSDIVSAVA